MGIVIPIITDFNASGMNKAVKSFKQLETNGQRAAFAVMYLSAAATPASVAPVTRFSCPASRSDAAAH